MIYLSIELVSIPSYILAGMLKNDKESKAFADLVPYKIIDHENGDAWVESLDEKEKDSQERGQLRPIVVNA